MKFKFQGPPFDSEHHLTALHESDSIMILWERNLSQLRVIWTAQWIARTSVEFISIGGIGHEKIHRKLPLELRRTPPIADRSIDRLWEASIFHFRMEEGGGP